MENMVEILNVDALLDETYEFTGEAGTARMVTFHGSAGGEFFTGTILPGAVDTQKILKGGERSLSARYILEGTDYLGQKCRIFIENNAVLSEDGRIGYTTPTILTDSKALRTFMFYEVTGIVTPTEKGVHISFYMEE